MAVHSHHDGPHQHDWWYFWVVYDISEHKPTQAMYNFHHNIRVFDWSAIQKDNFHPNVWVEAGGHRHLFESPVSGGTVAEKIEDKAWELWDPWVSDEDIQSAVKSYAGNDLLKSYTDDYTYGLFITFARGYIDFGWPIGVKTFAAPTGMQTGISGWRNGNDDFNAGTMLNIEDDYWNRVYVYSVSDSYISGTTDYLVGYTGDNFPTRGGVDSEYGSDYNHWPSFSGGEETHLPWVSGISNTVRQAWDWNEDIAKDSNGNYYYTDSIMSPTTNEYFPWSTEVFTIPD